VTDVDSPAVLYWFRLTRPAGRLPRFLPYLIDEQAGIGTQIDVADVNGDGAPDVLTSRRKGAFVFFNNRGVSPIMDRGRRNRRETGNARFASGAPPTPVFWSFPGWDALGRATNAVTPAPMSHP
jgi:hypothetical protein